MTYWTSMKSICTSCTWFVDFKMPSNGAAFIYLGHSIRSKDVLLRHMDGWKPQTRSLKVWKGRAMRTYNPDSELSSNGASGFPFFCLCLRETIRC